MPRMSPSKRELLPTTGISISFLPSVQASLHFQRQFLVFRPEASNKCKASPQYWRIIQFQSNTRECEVRIILKKWSHFWWDVRMDLLRYFRIFGMLICRLRLQNKSTTVVLGHRQLLVTKIYLGKQYMTMIQPPDPGSHSSGLGGTPVTFNFSWSNFIHAGRALPWTKPMGRKGCCSPQLYTWMMHKQMRSCSYGRF